MIFGLGLCAIFTKLGSLVSKIQISRFIPWIGAKPYLQCSVFIDRHYLIIKDRSCRITS